MLNEENGRINDNEEGADPSASYPVSSDYYENGDFLDKTEEDDEVGSDNSEIEEFLSENEGGEEETHVSAQDYAYKNILQENGKPKTKIWSVISLILSISSVVVSFFTVFGIIPGILAIGSLLLSRKVLGYFDGIAIAAIMLSVFGIVFPLAKLAFDPIFEAIYNV